MTAHVNVWHRLIHLHLQAGHRLSTLPPFIKLKHTSRYTCSTPVLIFFVPYIIQLVTLRDIFFPTTPCPSTKINKCIYWQKWTGWISAHAFMICHCTFCTQGGAGVHTNCKRLEKTPLICRVKKKKKCVLHLKVFYSASSIWNLDLF